MTDHKFVFLFFGEDYAHHLLLSELPAGLFNLELVSFSLPAKLTKLLVLGFESGNYHPQLSAATSPWDDFVSFFALCRRRKGGDSVESLG